MELHEIALRVTVAGAKANKGVKTMQQTEAKLTSKLYFKRSFAQFAYQFGAT